MHRSRGAPGGLAPSLVHGRRARWTIAHSWVWTFKRRACRRRLRKPGGTARGGFTVRSRQRLVDKLGRPGRRLHFCYEAGPCGHGVHRLLREWSVHLEWSVHSELSVHRDRPRDSRLHLGDCPHGAAKAGLKLTFDNDKSRYAWRTAGPGWGTLVACYESILVDARPLERGGPETKPRSCGNQPAHETLLNRRLRTLPFARPIVHHQRTSAQAGDDRRAIGA